MGYFSELRRDLVSDDWVVIATGRAKRPHDFLSEEKIRFQQPRKSCPFEGEHPFVIARFAVPGKIESDWWVEVVPNKYPAFGKGEVSFAHRTGPYQWVEGVGSHEVVISRDHTRALADMTDEEARVVVRAYYDRFQKLSRERYVLYVSIFHNHGRLAGASISHPHSQIIAIPVVPPDIARSLEGSEKYFRNHKTCVHCAMVRYEMEARERIVYENENFVVFAPFASRSAFELRIFPKRHHAHFLETSEEELGFFANALRIALAKLSRGLHNPDYNFFIHTAPNENSRQYHHYHWHLEIIPKTGIWAGFEIGTGIEIATIAPETAAVFLRDIVV